MKKLLITIGVVVVLGVVWWLASPLFINVEVDEELPGVVQQEEVEEEKTNLDEQLTKEEKAQFEEEMEKVNVPDKTMEEEMPAKPEAVSQGNFVAVAHTGTGLVKIVKLASNDHILRFENLDVDNGPDLRVLLSENSNVRSSGDLGNYIELAKLKGNKGNQNYEIPKGIDVGKYKSAVIYCKPFSVVFNSANLK